MSEEKEDMASRSQPCADAQERSPAGQRSDELAAALKRSFDGLEVVATEGPCGTCHGLGVTGIGEHAGGCDDCGGTGLEYGCDWDEDAAWRAVAEEAVKLLTPAERDAVDQLACEASNAARSAPEEQSSSSPSLEGRDLAELKRVAEAATPGPWEHMRGRELVRAIRGDWAIPIFETRLPQGDPEMPTPTVRVGDEIVFRANSHDARFSAALAKAQDNATFIATFDPPTVLSLLHQLETAKRERDEAREDRAATWCCFHCDFETSDRRQALLHFGLNPAYRPACRMTDEEAREEAFTWEQSFRRVWEDRERWIKDARAHDARALKAEADLARAVELLQRADLSLPDCYVTLHSEIAKFLASETLTSLQHSPTERRGG